MTFLPKLLIGTESHLLTLTYMSDANVGARRRETIRNHIFVINGIIFGVLSSKKKKARDIQIMDYNLLLLLLLMKKMYLLCSLSL